MRLWSWKFHFSSSRHGKIVKLYILMSVAPSPLAFANPPPALSSLLTGVSLRAPSDRSSLSRPVAASPNLKQVRRLIDLYKLIAISSSFLFDFLIPLVSTYMTPSYRSANRTCGFRFSGISRIYMSEEKRRSLELKKSTTDTGIELLFCFFSSNRHCLFEVLDLDWMLPSITSSIVPGFGKRAMVMKRVMRVEPELGLFSYISSWAKFCAELGSLAGLRSNEINKDIVFNTSDLPIQNFTFGKSDIHIIDHTSFIFFLELWSREH
ncbi:hypothetical protein FCM35_KLT03929 [Carex littledalei]|uniref:Uncharacterized protein n=1 Tax=Carex littledalei TaxID=544730 RepID=A0A833QNQ1_9POAL|nr:hypothetical protein FCM35_KLT03929 [Carex littledalei]